MNVRIFFAFEQCKFILSAICFNDLKFNDNDDDDDDELFLWYGCPTKPGPLSEILTISNLHTPQAGFEPTQNLSSGFVE